MKPYRGIPIDKPIDCGEFVYGWLVESGGHSYIIVGINPTFVYKTDNIVLLQSYLRVHPSTVGQQIGQQDKNKKEIYKGDKYKDAEGIVSNVEWGLGEWSLFPIDMKTPVRSLYWRNICKKTQGEVIGTIHDKESKDEPQKDA